MSTTFPLETTVHWYEGHEAGRGGGGGVVWSGRAIVFQYDNDEVASGRRVSLTK